MKKFIKNFLSLFVLSYLIFSFSFSVSAQEVLDHDKVFEDLKIKFEGMDSYFVQYQNTFASSTYDYNSALESLKQGQLVVIRNNGLETQISNDINSSEQKILNNISNQKEKDITEMFSYVDPKDIDEMFSYVDSSKYNALSNPEKTDNFKRYNLLQEEREKLLQRNLFLTMRSKPIDVMYIFLLRSELILVKTIKLYELLSNDNEKTIAEAIRSEQDFEEIEDKINDSLFELSKLFPYIITELELGSYSDSQILEISQKIVDQIHGKCVFSWKDLGIIVGSESFQEISRYVYWGLAFINKAIQGINTVKSIYFPLLESKQTIRNSAYWLLDSKINPSSNPGLSDCVYLAYGNSTFSDNQCKPVEFLNKLNLTISSYEKIGKAVEGLIEFKAFYIYLIKKAMLEIKGTTVIDDNLKEHNRWILFNEFKKQYSLEKIQEYLQTPQEQQKLYELAYKWYVNVIKEKGEKEIAGLYDNMDDYHFDYYEKIKDVRALFLDKVVRLFVNNSNYKNVIDIDKIITEDSEEELNKLNSKLDEIVPKVLKTVSPLYDEDCLDGNTQYWTKGIEIDSLSEKSLVTVKETNKSIGETYTTNVLYFENGLSPTVTPWFRRNRVSVMNSNFQLHDNYSLMARSLFNTMKSIYSNYIQLSILMGKDDKGDLKANNTTNKNIFESNGSLTSISWSYFGFPKFDSLRLFYQRAFLSNLGLLDKESNVKRENGNLDDKEIETVIKNKQTEIGKKREQYYLNLEKARDNINKIDEEINKIGHDSTDIHKELVKNISDKYLNFTKALLEDANFKIPEINLIVDSYNTRLSLNETIMTALKAYMKKAYPNDEEFKKEWKLRKEGYIFTKDEVLYALYYFIINKSNFYRASELNTMDKLNEIFIDSDSPSDKSEYFNECGNDYATRVISEVYHREGLLLSVLLIDLGGRSNVRILAEESKKALFDRSYASDLTPLELASKVHYNIQTNELRYDDNEYSTYYDYKQMKITKRVKIENYGRRAVEDPTHAKIPNVLNRINFLGNLYGESMAKIGYEIFIKYPCKLMNKRKSIIDLERSKELIFFSFIPVKYAYDKYNSETFKTKSGEVILTEYRNFLIEELKKYNKYIIKYNNDVSDIEKDLKETFVPNLVLMGSLLEKYPQYKKQVCSLQKQIKADEQFTDYALMGVGLATIPLFFSGVTAPLAKIILVGTAIADAYVQYLRTNNAYATWQNVSNLSYAMVNLENLESYRRNDDFIKILKQSYQEQQNMMLFHMIVDVIVIGSTIKPAVATVSSATSRIATSRWKAVTESWSVFKGRWNGVKGSSWIKASTYRTWYVLRLVRDELNNIGVISKLGNVKDRIAIIRGLKEGATGWKKVGAILGLLNDIGFTMYAGVEIGQILFGGKELETRDIIYSVPMLLAWSFPGMPIFMGDIVFFIIPPQVKQILAYKMEIEHLEYSHIEEMLESVMVVQDGVYSYLIDPNSEDLVVSMALTEDLKFVPLKNKDGSINPEVRLKYTEGKGVKAISKVVSTKYVQYRIDFLSGVKTFDQIYESMAKDVDKLEKKERNNNDTDSNNNDDNN